MSVHDHQDEARFQSSPTGPWVAPPRQAADPPASRPLQRRGNGWRVLSVLIFVAVVSGIGIRAYRDLCRPEAWQFWKDQYVSPTLHSSLIPNADVDGSGHRRLALFINGSIGPAAPNWLRERLDEAHLVAGDVIVMSSPGGDLMSAMIMGSIIRSRGLVTAVGVADASGRIRPSSCASACVLAFAGGTSRLGIAGSALGVHQFSEANPTPDPVAATQRTTGAILNYMTRMGVSSSIVEEMSRTADIRWLSAREAFAMNLITDPIKKR